MPGFEWIGAEERAAVDELFTKANGVFFRLGFDALRNGVYTVKTFEERFAKRLGAPHALCVSSGTAALKVALEALGVGPGDEVITQAFTFVATAEAIIECGAIPVIAEVDETLNLSAATLAPCLSPRTKAVIVVHMLGTPADLDPITELLGRSQIPLIEDTAWGLGATYNDQALGTHGAIGTFSFDYAKAITTGEGGMVVSKHQDLDFRARAYHDHGHENNPDKMRWEDSRHGSGFNYRMSELNAAVGLAQLAKLDAMLDRQRQIDHELKGIISRWPALKLRACPAKGRPSGEGLVFFAQDRDEALSLRENLLKEGVGTKILPEALTWHFARTWTHMPSLVKRAGGDLSKTLLQSQALLERAVCLPISLKMAPEVPEKLSRALKQVLGAPSSC